MYHIFTMTRRRYALTLAACIGMTSVIAVFLLWQQTHQVVLTPTPLSTSSSSSESNISSHAKTIQWHAFSGALVRVSMQSTAGVLLDEIRESQREKTMKFLLRQPDEYWIDRAKRQIRLTSLRLNFRQKGNKQQLPLPPEESWKIALKNKPERQTLEGHDLVTVDFSYEGTLLTSLDSPGATEPVLGKIGGEWRETFVLPIDPEFIFQRTGFACVNESQFPPNSVDAEEMDLFFDDQCTTENRLTSTGCHQSALPTLSCKAALREKIGRVDVTVIFTRLPWQQTVADAVRTGTVTNEHGPDLQPYQAGFKNHRFTYRYIPKNSCTLVERCVGGSGWRQVLMFPTGDVNVGSAALEIGTVDYFHETNGSVLSKHGVFEYSACHNHYHFSHYGSFTLGKGREAITQKNGFCLQPSSRIFNNELTPLHHPYTNCIRQGVSVGWIDEYRMGLECQWVDVTDVPPKDAPLSFVSNPDGLLCEGTLQKNAQGTTLFEETTFKTSLGAPVEKPQCDAYPQWFENNTESYSVHLPGSGESYVTHSCAEGVFGELRNCGFTPKREVTSCTPGTQVSLRCSIPPENPAQIIRVCEASTALGIGIPCTYNDAVASAVIDSEREIRFTCPVARDDSERGGHYALLTGSLFPSEKISEITCTQISR